MLHLSATSLILRPIAPLCRLGLISVAGSGVSFSIRTSLVPSVYPIMIQLTTTANPALVSTPSLPQEKKVERALYWRVHRPITSRIQTEQYTNYSPSRHSSLGLIVSSLMDW